MVKRTFLTLSVFLGALAGVFLCTSAVRSEQDNSTITTASPCEPSSYGYEDCWYDDASNYCPYPSVQADTTPPPISEEVAEKPSDDPVTNAREYDGYESKYYGYQWEYDDYDSAYEDFQWSEPAADPQTETLVETEQADAEAAETATVADESAGQMRGYCDDWAEYCYDEEYRDYEAMTQADCVPEAQTQDADKDQHVQTTSVYDHDYQYGYDYDYWYRQVYDYGYAYQYEPNFDRTEEVIETETAEAGEESTEAEAVEMAEEAFECMTTEVADEMLETETAEAGEEITEVETVEAGEEITEVETVEVAEEAFECLTTEVAEEMTETETAEAGEEITGTETSIHAPTLREDASEQAHGCYYSDYYGDCYYGDYYRDYSGDYDDYDDYGDYGDGTMADEACQVPESADDSMENSMNRAAILTLARSLDQMGSALQMLSRHLTEMATPEVATRAAASGSNQH